LIKFNLVDVENLVAQYPSFICKQNILQSNSLIREQKRTGCRRTLCLHQNVVSKKEQQDQISKKKKCFFFQAVALCRMQWRLKYVESISINHTHSGGSFVQLINLFFSKWFSRAPALKQFAKGMTRCSYFIKTFKWVRINFFLLYLFFK
jgi:hypothetical protein